MKRTIKIVLISFLAVIFSCNQSGKKPEAHADEKLYTCPMHPEIIRNKPGQCPICGMDLVEKVTGGEKANDKDIAMLLEPTNKYVVSKIATVKPQERQVSIKSVLTGFITYNTQQINTVSARVSGRIEKLYVKYKYQPVSKGQKLMDIYSKELETEQQNLLFLLKNDAENLTLIKASEKRLQLLGLTQEQINQVKSSGQIFYSITIYSPYSGHLHDVISTDNTSMEDGNMASSKQETQALQIKEGAYVSKGQTIFNIYDTQSLWAILNIPPDVAGTVAKGQKVKLQIDGLEDKEVTATIDFIEPALRENQKSIASRVYLNNPNNEIKIGAIVKAKLIDKNQKGLFVPSSSVVSLGLSNVVFIKQNGLFKAQKVVVNNRSKEWTEIVSGITKESEIAKNAQLLMDSESFIKVEEP